MSLTDTSLAGCLHSTSDCILGSVSSTTADFWLGPSIQVCKRLPWLTQARQANNKLSFRLQHNIDKKNDSVTVLRNQLWAATAHELLN
mmetsp:Transcript_106840/g.185622  ORF Transcript_106840/g.185622 Transcript_106840/m.185622 type:complete len:88 (-) Transcript_106840:3-266(-)